jgi:hypothetical protein
MSARIGWPAVVRQAREIAGSYDTPVILRQLFYRLYPPRSSPIPGARTSGCQCSLSYTGSLWTSCE